MTLTRVHIEVAAGVLAFLFFILGLHEWLVEHDNRIQAQSIQAAQKTVIDQAAADRLAHQKQDEARDAQTAATLEAMQKALLKVQTPTQIVGWSQQQLADAIKGIQITVPTPTAENPHPSASVTIPEASLPGLRDTIEQCKECSVKLTTAQADLSSRVEQQKLADTQIQALKTDNAALSKAIKGGSWLHRTGRALVIAGCAGLGGLAGNQQGNVGAGIGAAGAAIFCTLSTH